jgi:hypothetical protein
MATAPTPEALDDMAPVLALCPAAQPLAFNPFLQPDDSGRRWLTSALPLTLAHWVAEPEAIPVSPTVVPVAAERTEADPVVKKARSPKTTDKTAQHANPH